MTGLAVYGLAFKSAELPPDHPLSTIPDDFGEFPPADRKKVTASRAPVDGPLPEVQKATLGGKIVIGQLLIEPLGVERRKLTLIRESSEEKQRVPLDFGLVLRLKVTNASPDLPIYPLDPAFDRRPLGRDTPATRIVVDADTFPGGPIRWPFGTRVTREYEESQVAENQPLAPGETREYFVCSADDPRLVNALRHARLPILWRVQVRRGLIEYNGRDVPVTAIIGVVFDKGDVAGL
jgi:hypothetical protein